jgi:hypothetical protein
MERDISSLYMLQLSLKQLQLYAIIMLPIIYILMKFNAIIFDFNGNKGANVIFLFRLWTISYLSPLYCCSLCILLHLILPSSATIYYISTSTIGYSHVVFKICWIFIGNRVCSLVKEAAIFIDCCVNALSPYMHMPRQSLTALCCVLLSRQFCVQGGL